MLLWSMGDSAAPAGLMDFFRDRCFQKCLYLRGNLNG